MNKLKESKKLRKLNELEREILYADPVRAVRLCKKIVKLRLQDLND